MGSGVWGCVCAEHPVPVLGCPAACWGPQAFRYMGCPMLGVTVLGKARSWHRGTPGSGSSSSGGVPNPWVQPVHITVTAGLGGDSPGPGQFVTLSIPGAAAGDEPPRRREVVATVGARGPTSTLRGDQSCRGAQLPATGRGPSAQVLVAPSPPCPSCSRSLRDGDPRGTPSPGGGERGGLCAGCRGVLGSSSGAPPAPAPDPLPDPRAPLLALGTPGQPGCARVCTSPGVRVPGECLHEYV